MNLSNRQIGLLSTSRMFGGGIANVPAGYVADRYPGRFAQILGLSVSFIGVTGFLLGISDNYFMVTIMAACMVGSISFYHPSAISNLSRQFSARRGFAISLHGTGGSVGQAVGPIVVGLLLGIVSWDFLFRISIIPATVSGFVIWSLLSRIPAEASSNLSISKYLNNVSVLLKTRSLLLILVFTGGFAGAQNILMTFFPLYLRENLDFSSAELGIYLAMAQVMGIISQPVMGFFSDKWGRRVILAPALIVLSISYFLIPLAGSGIYLILTVCIMGAFLYSLMAIFVAAAVDLVEDKVQATTVSLVFGFATAIAGVAPGIAGIFADLFGIQSTFWVASSIVGCTGVMSFITNWESNK